MLASGDQMLLRSEVKREEEEEMMLLRLLELSGRVRGLFTANLE